MSRSTCSDIVKNVASIGDMKEFHNFLDPDSDENIENINEDAHSSGWKNPPSKNGWTMVIPEPRKWHMSGKKKSLYADLFQKDDKKVFVLNTSEYASVGEYWYVVYSDDKSAVEMFLKDFGIESEIEDMDSVCQTL